MPEGTSKGRSRSPVSILSDVDMAFEQDNLHREERSEVELFKKEMAEDVLLDADSFRVQAVDSDVILS